MKKILITIIACVALSVAHAQTAIYVQPKNGEQVAFPLSEKPKITFENSTMIIKSQSFALNNVQNLSFKEIDETRVANVIAQEQLQVYPNPVTNGQLIIDNGQLTANSDPLSIVNYPLSIKIYAMNGQLVATYPTAGKQTTIDIGHLPAGTYIVKIGNRSAKIIKR